MKKLSTLITLWVITSLLFITAVCFAQDTTVAPLPIPTLPGEGLFGLDWVWWLIIIGGLEGLLRILPINSKWTVIGILQMLYKAIPNNAPDKRKSGTLPIILLAMFLAACGTYKPVTKFEQPTIIVTDSNFCVSGGLSASINQDSLFLIFEDGFILGNGTNTVKISWKSLGTQDPFNGQIVIEPNLCINNSDFCLTGQYWVQVHQSNFYATLQKGLTFGTPTASAFVRYVNGKLSVTPKVCMNFNNNSTDNSFR